MVKAACDDDFNPRAPRGARPAADVVGLWQALFQSTCPARGTTALSVEKSNIRVISIHVPREGHDCNTFYTICTQRHFNPRAPRGARLSIFAQHRNVFGNFNPRAPRGARHSPKKCFCLYVNFNPRAPRGARHSTKNPLHCWIAFQSTCPARGTTRHIGRFTGQRVFQSTCPARGTTVVFCRTLKIVQFQSTCPARGTTLPGKMPYVARIISIHVPREGHDQHIRHDGDESCQFQSTCPARGTTRKQTALFLLDIDFNPRAPRGARRNKK